MITGGQFFFDEKSIKIAKVGGTLGNSSFAGLTAKIALDEKADFEIMDGQMSVSTDELYPWITSFEKIKPVLTMVPSMSGIIAISSLKLKGPFKQPKDWRFTVDGETKKFTLNAAFLPGKAEDTTGMFRITQDELSLKDIQTRMSDSVLKVSGTFREFPARIDTIALSLQGEVGPKVMDGYQSNSASSGTVGARSCFCFSVNPLMGKR